jgi:hypothetical protein
MMSVLRISFALSVALTACNDGDKDADALTPEGQTPGDCNDRADNDGDGLFDCDDDGCFGAPDCDESGGGSGGSGGADGGGDSSGGSGSGGGDGGSGGDGTEEVPPPVAVLQEAPLKCAYEGVILNGSGSYSPSDDHRITTWEWLPGPGETSSATFNFDSHTYPGDEDEISLTVTDDLGQSSTTVSTTVVTNTPPTMEGFSISGDCFAANVESERLVFRWNEDCNRYRCSCTVTVHNDDVDGNQTYSWDYNPGESSDLPDATVSGSTITWTFPSDFDLDLDWSYYCLWGTNRVTMQLSDPCLPDDFREIDIDASCIYGTY